MNIIQWLLTTAILIWVNQNILLSKYTASMAFMVLISGIINNGYNKLADHHVLFNIFSYNSIAELH